MLHSICYITSNWRCLYMARAGIRNVLYRMDSAIAPDRHRPGLQRNAWIRHLFCPPATPARLVWAAGDTGRAAIVRSGPGRFIHLRGELELVAWVLARQSGQCDDGPNLNLKRCPSQVHNLHNLSSNHKALIPLEIDFRLQRSLLRWHGVQQSRFFQLVTWTVSSIATIAPTIVWIQATMPPHRHD